ncbi:MAG: hypothetical protein ACRDSM_21440 [Pseudonocardiaceae bacterium]
MPFREESHVQGLIEQGLLDIDPRAVFRQVGGGLDENLRNWSAIHLHHLSQDSCSYRSRFGSGDLGRPVFIELDLRETDPPEQRISRRVSEGLSGGAVVQLRGVHTLEAKLNATVAPGWADPVGPLQRLIVRGVIGDEPHRVPVRLVANDGQFTVNAEEKGDAIDASLVCRED